MGNQMGFESAKRALETLLEREWQLRGSAPKEYLRFLQEKYPGEQWVSSVAEDSFYLRRDMPEIMMRGTNQIVFYLSDGYVCKATTINDKVVLSTHHIFANGDYATASESTIRVLKELGFEVPEHHYIEVQRVGESFKVKEHGLAFVIATDLSEDGRYKVEDVTAEHFRYLNNGQELQRQFKQGVKRLLDIHRHKNMLYSMSINGHGTMMEPQEAIERTFLIQIDSVTHTGKLVLGDLDNLSLR